MPGLLFILALVSCAGFLDNHNPGGGTNTNTTNSGESNASNTSSKDITSFAIVSPATTGIIDGTNITVSLTSETSLSNLVATFTITGDSVKVGSTFQITGVTTNNYTNPVVYTVTAKDGSIKTYLVTVRIKQWQTLGGAGFSQGEADYPSLAIDKNTGSVYVAYSDTPNSSRLAVKKFNGSAWVDLGTNIISAGGIGSAILVLNSSGNPIVVYRDTANGNKATVQQWNGSAWQVVGTAGFSPAMTWFSIALDTNSLPYVAYSDNANNKASVLRFNGTAWVAVGAAGFSAGNAQALSIQIDMNNTPYVAYQDDANGSKATVMKLDGTNWVVVGSAGFSAGQVGYLPFVIDKTGTPFVAYRDFANSDKATVMKFNGTSWITVGSAGFTSGAVYSMLRGFAIDSSGNPIVAYRDVANGYEATVMKWDGSAWNTLGPVAFSAGGAQSLEIVFDKDDNPYVSFMDDVNSFKATVMYYK